MKNHTNSKSSFAEISKDMEKKELNQVEKSIQPERANLSDLYKYAEKKYLAILFIGITVLLVYKFERVNSI